MAHTSFSDACTITPSGDGQFDAVVSEWWTVGGKPNGGYLLALMGRAAVASSLHEHVIAASTTFVSAPDPGPVTITVTVLRTGRAASQLRASLAQGGKACAEALIVTGTLRPDEQPFWSDGVPSPGTVALADCPRVPSVMPNGAPAPLMTELEMRIEPATAGYLSSAPSGDGVLRGWLTLPGGERFDPTSLLCTIDCFPPATFDVEVTGWVPTLELTAYIRALPAPGPLRILQRAHLVDGQRMDEACFIWDSAGRLVAQSTQLAAIRLG